jgi:hypothetical protein
MAKVANYTAELRSRVVGGSAVLQPFSSNSFRSVRYYHLRGCEMAVRITRSAGMLLLAIWLILDGLAGLITLPLPPVLMAALALIAGILILIGM